ncbi:MAG: WYL domain-containing protein [Propionibacteriales bacterium]|nr:WYL domain-containing protein [Propionibacteriales bacterium]
MASTSARMLRLLSLLQTHRFWPGGARFRPRELPAEDAAAYVRDSLASVPTRYHVAVRVHTAAADVENVVRGWGTVEPVDVGSCRLEMNVDTLHWPALVLGSVGAEFEVLEPPELTDYLRTMGELFIRASGCPASTVRGRRDSAHARLPAWRPR